MQDAVIGVTLDRSGSMRSMWSDAVGGFNAFKQKQADADGKSWFVLVYFDNEIERGVLGVDASEFEDLRENDPKIFPRGATALIDATLTTIEETERWLADNPDFDGKVYQVVITDGWENASTAPASALKARVEEKEAAGWEFIYLAANVDLEQTRQQYGFVGGTSLGYSGQTVGQTYNVVADAVLRSRAGGDTEFTDDERRLTGGK